MSHEFDLLMRAECMIEALKAKNIIVHQDKFGNIVAKASGIQTAVFLNQFEGSYGEQALSQAQLLYKEFGL